MPVERGIVKLSGLAFSSQLSGTSKVLTYSFLLRRSNNHSHSKDRITSRPSPLAERRMPTWEGSCSSNSFQRIILKTSPPLPVDNFNQSSFFSLSLLSCKFFSWTSFLLSFNLNVYKCMCWGS